LNVSETIQSQEGVYVPNWSTNDVLIYQRERAEQERKVHTEQAALRNIDKRAKDSGLPVEVIKAVIKLRKRDKTEAEVWINQFLRIGAANGIVGPQLNIFGQEGFEPTDEQQQMVNLATAEDRGFQAGRGGMGKDANPYQPGTEESQAWVKWWANGVAAFKHANGGVAPAAADKEQPRARQRKMAEVKAIAAPLPEVGAPVSEPEAAKPKKRGPGRPPKARPNGSATVVAVAKRGRGRPPKSAKQPTA
jgi:ribosome modulation factor